MNNEDKNSDFSDMSKDKIVNKVQINRSKRSYSIKVVDSEFILNLWQEIETILYRVFADSNFNDNFVRTRPAEHTYKNLINPYQKGLKHIVALDLDDNILGAFFVIPCYKPEGKEDCDVGWIFTIELYPRFRHEIMNALLDRAHELIKVAGFKRIITEMGTEAGANFVSKKHGYVHTPTAEQYNRWTKEFN